MPSVPLLIVDAFTDRPFAGNPAAVCFLDAERDAAWMQSVAAEMNLAETAFVRKLDDGFELRWFTPLVEVDLCGHATLAAAHAMWEKGVAERGRPIKFQSRSGVLRAAMREVIELDFPATPAEECEPPAGLLEALGANPVLSGTTKFDSFLLLDSEQELRALAPDFALLAKVSTRGVIVTSSSDDPQFDFVSRFFAPAVGINEDPVTGSAHCCLAPFWSQRLGKQKLVGFQASARGGVVRVRVNGARVMLGGQAVTVVRGELVV